nr:DNA-formamidopyrimidine glycosylase family protein [uncultured Fluviicola sp.]
MPEGPSIVILKEGVQKFNRKKIVEVSGNSKIDQSRLAGQKVLEFKSWGKHFLICFSGFTLKIHFLMFGSYRIDEQKPEASARLSFVFENGELNFYSCSVKFLEGDLDSHYDWSGDVMNDTWDPKKAKAKLKERPNLMVCDALLEQDIFGGVGNIIKNEVLYRIKIHPESVVGKLSEAKLNSLIKEARIYSFQFLEWKKNYELKKHWLAHTKTWCLRCNLPIIKKYTGVKNRRSFFCVNCQKLRL